MVVNYTFKMAIYEYTKPYYEAVSQVMVKSEFVIAAWCQLQ